MTTMTKQQATDIAINAYKTYLSASHSKNTNDNALLKLEIDNWISYVGLTPEQALSEIGKALLYFVAIDDPAAFPGYTVSLGQTNAQEFVESLPSVMVVDFLYPASSASARTEMVSALEKNTLSNAEYTFGFIKAIASNDKPSLKDVVAAVTQEGMALPLTDGIQQLYLAYFGRPAESAGLNYWTAKHDKGEFNLDGIAVEFSKANEYAAKYGSAGFAGLVTSVYRNVLGRDPESSQSLSYWVQELELNKSTPATLVQSFLGTDDAYDRQNIINRVEVSKYYTEASGISYSVDQGYALVHSVTPSRASVDAAKDKVNNMSFGEAFAFADAQYVTNEITIVGGVTESFDFV